MKGRIGAIVIACLLFSCQESETVSEFTGNESTYALQQASDYKVSGSVTFKEKKDGSALIIIELEGTDGDLKLPAHLHLGDISTPDAEIAALLNPVLGKTGRSETPLTHLANEAPITYNDLAKLEASIKVHLSDVGPERDIVLAGGNIGASASNGSANGRLGIGVCKSD